MIEEDSPVGEVVKWSGEISSRSKQIEVRDAVADLVVDIERWHDIRATAAMGLYGLILLPALGCIFLAMHLWLAVACYVMSFSVPIIVYLRERANVARHVQTRLGLLESKIKELAER